MVVSRPALLFRALWCGAPLAVASIAAGAEPPADARVLAKEGVEAHQAKDEATFLSKMEAAAALRPDYPRILVNLAAAQVANDHPDDAIATLQKLAALGVHSPVEKSADFAALRDRKDFQEVVKLLAKNLDPQGKGEIAFSLKDMTGLIEGIAWREKTDEFFFGDVHLRAVWARSKDNKVRRFSQEDGDLLGVFGLAVDENRGALWAATSSVTATQGFTGDHASGGLAELDLDTGKVKRVILAPADGRDHAMGDLAIAPDGGVYLADSAAHVIWRLAPNGSELERWLESDEFESPQGLAFSDDGRALYLTDYVNGLLRIDVNSRTVRRLSIPANTTLLGVDALVRAPDGTLITVQNGVRPLRVLRLTLDDAGTSVTQADVIESAHLTMGAPALGCIAKGEFFFVGNSGWSRFENAEPKPTPPRPVPVFHTSCSAGSPDPAAGAKKAGS